MYVAEGSDWIPNKHLPILSPFSKRLPLLVIARSACADCSLCICLIAPSMLVLDELVLPMPCKQVCSVGRLVDRVGRTDGSTRARCRWRQQVICPVRWYRHGRFSVLRVLSRRTRRWPCFGSGFCSRSGPLWRIELSFLDFASCLAGRSGRFGNAVYYRWSSNGRWQCDASVESGSLQVE